MMDSAYFKKYILLKEYETGYGYRGIPEGYVRISGTGKQAKAFIRAQHMKFSNIKFFFTAGICINGKVEKIEAGNSISKLPTLSVEKEINIISNNNINTSLINLFYISVQNNKGETAIPLIGADRGININRYIPLLLEKNVQLNDNNKNERENLVEEHIYTKAKTTGTFHEIEEKHKGILNLQKVFNEQFKKCEPFNVSRQDYIWYEVFDLSLLSNVLYSNGIQIPIFANPKILIGLFKFGHLITGIYNGANSKYFVLGVPAIKEYDDEPFEKLCRWASISYDNKKKYDGYWLIYMDLETGQFLK